MSTTESPPSPAETPPGTAKTGPGSSVAPRVFFPAAGIILVFVIGVMVAPDAANTVIGGLQGGIVGGLSWYYALIVAVFVAFAIWMGLSHFGDIKLGPDDEKPEFSTFSWLAMLFAAGMGIGLVYYGVAEPLSHFAEPKPGSGANLSPGERADGALIQTFLHWGLHPWAIYVVIGLAVAYSVHRRGRPVSIRWALEPLLGDRVKGWMGDAIDIVAVVGTLFGVATSLGLGVLQITAGLEFLEILQNPGNLVRVVLIGAITLLATASVVSGVGKGIKWLSNINMGVAGAMLLFVLIVGPTLFIFRDYIQSVGLYLQNLVQMSFDTTAHQGQNGIDWQAQYATFYWGWWISWAPFVGVFIARVSRGRTVRQFVGGVLLVPSLIGFLWFAVFGGATLFQQIRADGLGFLDPASSSACEEAGAPCVNSDSSLFKLLETFPGGYVVCMIAIILIVLFFVTSSDSGSLVVDMLSSGGNPEPPKWSRVFWALLEGLVAAALLLAGGTTGLTALQTMAIVLALPFSVILIAMCFALYRQLHSERQRTIERQRREQREEFTDHVSESLVTEGFIQNPAKGALWGRKRRERREQRRRERSERERANRPSAEHAAPAESAEPAGGVATTLEENPQDYDERTES